MNFDVFIIDNVTTFLQKDVLKQFRRGFLQNDPNCLSKSYTSQKEGLIISSDP